MPLEESVRRVIDDYCTRDLPGDIQWHIDQFAFVSIPELQKRLGRAYFSARYISKLMEATLANGDRLHPFVKFQILQYASIFEAVVSHLLWSVYPDHPEVQQLQTHKAYKRVDAFGKSISMQYGTEELFACVLRDAKTPKASIPFADKVDCAVRIGFVDPAYADDIKRTYQLRNLAHIENEAERQIEVEIEQAKTAYWRVKPFLEKITTTLKNKKA